MSRATYSPEDNKLRLYTETRLTPEEFERVKAAGFRWAPQQKLFVAPMWTPAREDLLLEMCGEIGDEDTSLVERSTERAERFEDYSANRKEDAECARKAAEQLTNGIPIGQPITIGHHSEQRARRDAERIERTMNKAVKMWETATYWKERAAGALRAAKYKELPGVRARRIKKLEAEKRKQERDLSYAQQGLKFWTGDVTYESALRFSGGHYLLSVDAEFPLSKYPRSLPASQYEGPMSTYSALGGGDGPEYAVCSVAELKEAVIPKYNRNAAWATRWINHYENRLVYEMAMLEEQGKTDLLKPVPRPKQLPLCNYRQANIEVQNIYYPGRTEVYPQIEMTSAAYTNIPNDYRGTRVCENSHRVRTAMRGSKLFSVFLTDSKVHAKPAPGQRPEPEPPRLGTVTPRAEIDPESSKFVALKSSLAAGVQVVATPQLFPTPAALAQRMLAVARIQPGMSVLEPSAGTGALIRPIRDGMAIDCRITAVEINLALANSLKPIADRVLCADFLACGLAELGEFDRIIMNPPFSNWADIAHITHAMQFLRPGGILVAICANGPRQREKLMPLASAWWDLEPGTFQESGTNVNTAMLMLEK